LKLLQNTKDRAYFAFDENIKIFLEPIER